MTPWKRAAAAAAAVVLSILLGGCMMQSADSLYALPRQSDAYYHLEEAVDEVMTGEAEFAPPTSGSNQQAVQQVDLDGDSREEVVVFLKTGGEKPLKVYLFRMTETGNYEQFAMLEGEGSAFDSVEYLQMDGQSGMELLICRRVSTQIAKAVSVYAIRDNEVSRIMTASCADYVLQDLDNDGRKDVLLFREDSERPEGIAELFRWRDGRVVQDEPVRLSVPVDHIRRITAGWTCTEVPAVFVTGVFEEENSAVDVLGFYDLAFRNLTVSGDGNVSSLMFRSLTLYPMDVDGDDLVELPEMLALPNATAGDETNWIVLWSNLHPDGSREHKESTYHATSGGWYLMLPQAWENQLSISRFEEENATRCVSFNQWHGYDNDPEEIMTIRVFTGTDAELRAAESGGILLGERKDTAICAYPADNSLADKLTDEEWKACFCFIPAD